MTDLERAIAEQRRAADYLLEHGHDRGAAQAIDDWVKEEVLIRAEMTESPSVKVCNNCKGRGFVPKYFYEKSDPPCAMCDGKGFVPERKATPLRTPTPCSPR